MPIANDVKSCFNFRTPTYTKQSFLARFGIIGSYNIQTVKPGKVMIGIGNIKIAIFYINSC